MNHIKLFEIYTEEDSINLEEYISEDSIKEEFEKYGLYVDDIEYYDDNDIAVYFGSQALNGAMPNNITGILNKISDSIAAESWVFGQHIDTVIFTFDLDEITKKYNL